MDFRKLLPPPDRVMWQYGQEIRHYTEQQIEHVVSSALAAQNDRWMKLLRPLLQHRSGAEQVREGIQHTFRVIRGEAYAVPCRYADMCNEEGQCTNGCEDSR